MRRGTGIAFAQRRQTSCEDDRFQGNPESPDCGWGWMSEHGDQSESLDVSRERARQHGPAAWHPLAISRRSARSPPGPCPPVCPSLVSSLMCSPLSSGGIRPGLDGLAARERPAPTALRLPAAVAPGLENRHRSPSPQVKPGDADRIDDGERLCASLTALAAAGAVSGVRRAARSDVCALVRSRLSVTNTSRRVPVENPPPIGRSGCAVSGRRPDVSGLEPLADPRPARSEAALRPSSRSRVRGRDMDPADRSTVVATRKYIPITYQKRSRPSRPR